ncbi:MAG: hypothetical protein F4X58_13670 [Chloroflexi bacterium]|nr:hypothetical protein [Chloroflexota bacterium]MYC02954.1 hypothetical protein [Chloroflexota bacterium]
MSNITNAITAHSENTDDSLQTFRTGTHADGCTLTSVSLMIEINDSSGIDKLGYEVELWTANNNGTPNTKLATLSRPAALVDEVNTFAASGAGISLSANTLYAVIFNVTRRDSGLTGSAIGFNESSNLVETGAAGWTITNSNRTRAWNASPGTAWTLWSAVSFLITITGHDGPPHSAAPTRHSPDPPNLARSAVQWSPVGGIHPVPARIGEISSNKPKNASGSVDLSAIAASVSEHLRRYSRGFYVTVLVESASDQSGLIRRLDYGLARGSPLLKLQIWHVYERAATGINTVELLGDIFIGRPSDRLTAPVEVCLPAPGRNADRLRLAVKGRLDPHWQVLETTHKDGQLCAQTTRVSWLTLVEAPDEAA